MSRYNSGVYYLDGGGLDLSSESEQTIAGSWARACAAVDSGKAIVAYNTFYGDSNPVSPVPVFCMYRTSSQLILVGATLHITVTSANKCTVQDVAAS